MPDRVAALGLIQQDTGERDIGVQLGGKGDHPRDIENLGLRVGFMLQVEQQILEPLVGAVHQSQYGLRPCIVDVLKIHLAFPS